jgi:hypothetical protein
MPAPAGVLREPVIRVAGDDAPAKPGQGWDELEGHDAVQQHRGEGVRWLQPGASQRGGHGNLDHADTARGGAEAGRALTRAPRQDHTGPRNGYADRLDREDQAARIGCPVEHAPGERQYDGGRAQPEQPEPVHGCADELAGIAARAAHDPLGGGQQPDSAPPQGGPECRKAQSDDAGREDDHAREHTGRGAHGRGRTARDQRSHSDNGGERDGRDHTGQR